MDIKNLEQREYLVVKRNDLIQKSRYELSLAEQKTIAFICSMIKPTDSKINDLCLQYEFDINTYCKVCDLDYSAGGRNYNEIKGVLKKLRDRSIWVDTGDEEILLAWLSKAKINKRSGKVSITIDEDMIPYLFGLKEKFTQYQLYNILSMKSIYSIRLYELLKSYSFQKYKTFNIDEFRSLLDTDKIKSYNRFPDFRRNVLERAVNEINILTDLNVDYETILKGRKVVGIKFYIQVLKTTF